MNQSPYRTNSPPPKDPPTSFFSKLKRFYYYNGWILFFIVPGIILITCCAIGAIQNSLDKTERNRDLSQVLITTQYSNACSDNKYLQYSISNGTPKKISQTNFKLFCTIPNHSANKTDQITVSDDTIISPGETINGCWFVPLMKDLNCSPINKQVEFIK